MFLFLLVLEMVLILLLVFFYSVSWFKKKEEFLIEFRLKSKKRIVVVSIVLSMGVNFEDVRYVVNWGFVRNFLD